MTEAELLCKAGELLYGPLWRTHLGRVLNFDEKQIRRWASREYRPPARVWASLAGIISARCVDLAALKKAVSEHARASK